MFVQAVTSVMSAASLLVALSGVPTAGATDVASAPSFLVQTARPTVEQRVAVEQRIGAARPGRPTALSVTNLTSTSLTFRWKPPANAGSKPVDGYQVGRGSWVSALRPATTRAVEFPRLVPDTKVTLRVRAHSAAGYGPWGSLTVQTPEAPVKPLLGLPDRVAGIYWSSWNAHIPITQVPASYNLVYLFHAERGAAEGSVVWKADGPTTGQIDTVRDRGQRLILSTGGAGHGIDFHSRAVSRRLVDSVVAINKQFGGTLANPKIDGVDFNTFEADAVPNTDEYLWMFAELKRLFGSRFIITSPPAPWKQEDKQMVRAALAQGLMDYAAPQYYGGPQLSEPDYIISSVQHWIADVAGGRADRITVGFGMEDLPNFSTIAQIQTAWDAVEAQSPSIRGAFVWQHRTDHDRGWAFATTINPRVLD
jgi:hypothetical protein